jgi:hypothetical protein
MHRAPTVPRRLPPTLALLAALATTAALSAQPTADPSLVATTPYFAFHSDLDTNLHDALLIAGAARGRERPEPLFAEGAEAAECFAALPPSARLGWDLAVDYYARVVAKEGWQGRVQFLTRLALAGAHPDGDDEGARRLLSIGRGFLATAEPAYEACRWPVQDAANRRWIEHVVGRVNEHGQAVATRLGRFYGRSLHGLPLRMDVVAWAPPVGASTIWLSPEGGHSLLSTGTSERDALEIVFHEASHTLVGRSDPIPEALAAATEARGIEPPRDLWHVLLFYTTGEAVRRTLEEAGEVGYVPYLYEHPHLWAGSWGEYRGPVEAVWPAYLAGEKTVGEAVADIVDRVMAAREAGGES